MPWNCRFARAASSWKRRVRVVEGCLALDEALRAALELLHAAVQVVLLGLVARALLAGLALDDFELRVDQHFGVLDAIEEPGELAELFLHDGQAEGSRGDLAHAVLRCRAASR